jgi:hypothetical protein
MIYKNVEAINKQLHKSRNLGLQTIYKQEDYL